MKEPQRPGIAGDIAGKAAADLARRIQRDAAQPGMSVVLRASAGSGKTHVLVNRFLRLCVESPPAAGGQAIGPEPVHPRSILAITFTRKAAVQIQQRLRREAAELATAEPQALRARLMDLFGCPARAEPTVQELRRAAELYEKILENPAGLKVGTIHSFCQLILGRFAAEAGLDPRFTVLENPEDLIDEALDVLDTELARDQEQAAAARLVGSDPAAVRRAVREVFTEQMRMHRWLDRVRSEDQDQDPDRNAGLAEVGYATRTSHLPALLGELQTILFPGRDPRTEPTLAEFLPELAGALETLAGPGMDAVNTAVMAEFGDRGSGIPAKDPQVVRDEAAAAAGVCRKAAAVLTAPPSATAKHATPDPDLREDAVAAAQEAVAAARYVLLTRQGTLRAFTRIKKDGDLKARFQALMGQAGADVFACLRTIGRLELYRKNRSLLGLGLRALDIYDALKRRDRVVDFQDLEDLARRLMGDDAKAMSLFMRLDDSITCILVDEFQDTNFNQGEILKPLVEEFLAGGSGQTARPTVFFVGDPKQSIYGFRGAEPRLFAAWAERFARTAAGPLLDGPASTAVYTMPTNFRSLAAVVEGVCDLFTHEPLAGALEPDAREDVGRQWVRAEDPEDRGDLVLIPPYADDQEAATGPADGRSGDQIAAEAAAALVWDLKNGNARTWEQVEGRPVARALAWKDFLVLFRSRTASSLYEDAFRRAGIPIVPAGRGMLAGSREIQDILALLRWLVWPDDEVALATVLRSPLFRLDQKQFQTVLALRDAGRTHAARNHDGGANRPPRGLWEVLQPKQDDPVVGPAVRLLRRWRRRVGYEDCHDLLRRIYREGEVLARYRQSARQDQALYNLQRLFDLALGPELAATPTLQRMTELIQRAQRQGGQEEGIMPADQGGGRVRFMTIHAAKGLESPVVLLVDADRKGGKESPRIRLVPDSPSSPLLFMVGKDDRRGFELADGAGACPDPLQALAADALLKDQAEETHLLYVALTRARDRVFVLGGDKSGGSSDHDSPLRRLLRSADNAGSSEAMVQERPAPPPLAERLPAEPRADETAVADQAPEIPPSLARRIWRPVVLKERLRILTPSGGPEHTPPTGGTDSVPAGPATTRAAATARGILVHRLLQTAAAREGLPPGFGPQWEEAAALVGDPDLAWIFRPREEDGRAMSEVSVIAQRAVPGAGQPPERITGTIDRLVLRQGRADIVDFKTNRGAADPRVRQNLVLQYGPQMALYREAIALLYPDRAVRAWLLFTEPGLQNQARLAEVE